MNDGGAGTGFFFLIILAALYFLPAIIAGSRSHVNAGAITVLNLLLGWTLIGWVAALVWSFTNNVQLPQEGGVQETVQKTAPEAKSAEKRSSSFARVDEDGEVRSIDAEEYEELVADMKDVLERAEQQIGSWGGVISEADADAMDSLSDDLKWEIDALEEYDFRFRRADNRDAHRAFIVRAGQIAAILHDAAEEQRSPAGYEAAVKPLKGRFRIDYQTAGGKRLTWEVDAIGLSAVGERRYLWLYSEEASGIRSFRVDRIVGIEPVKGGERAEGEAVADWLAARVKKAA